MNDDEPHDVLCECEACCDTELADEAPLPAWWEERGREWPETGNDWET